MAMAMALALALAMAMAMALALAMAMAMAMALALALAMAMALAMALAMAMVDKHRNKSMNAREERKVIITMSPKELRDLADKMEKKWPKLKPGDSTFVDLIHCSDDLQVVLNLDQEYFHSLDKGK